MSKEDDFSLEQSEELIAHLKSGTPSEFEQLRSALNLLAHVPEMPPVSVPPILPSMINQPAPLIPVKSTKPRRTIITSIIVMGLFASVSLAAAAVTGIGPAPIVNIGHQTAKFVRGVADAVSHAVTGGNTSTAENKPVVPQVPGLTPAPTAGEDSSSNNNANSGSNSNSESDSESSNVPIPPLPNPLPPEPKKSTEGKSSEKKDSNSNDGSSNSSHESQSPSPEDSPTATPPPVITSPTSIPKGEKEHTESEGHTTPRPSNTPALPTAPPSSNSSDQSDEND